MQGRLSQAPEGVIQHFPVDEWEMEFEKLHGLGLDGIEWTIDENTFDFHPLVKGNKLLPWVYDQYGEPIPNKIITCDFFMQLKPFDSTIPFFDRVEKRFSQLLNSRNLGLDSLLVVPFVDDGAPKSTEHWSATKSFLGDLCEELKRCKSKVAIEFEIEPMLQKKFVEQFSDQLVGINFDMGNSASLGFDPADEIRTIRDNIKNIHIKDRVRGGTTVPLGLGSVKFGVVSSLLREIDYEKNLTLQCARKIRENPLDVVRQYVDFSVKCGLI